MQIGLIQYRSLISYFSNATDPFLNYFLKLSVVMDTAFFFPPETLPLVLAQDTFLVLLHFLLPPHSQFPLLASLEAFI